MIVVVENLPNCLATLKVEVEPERVSQAWNTVTADFGKQVKIPGYRPGKVPRSIVEKRFKKEIREEVEKKLLNDSTREAIQQEKLRVLGVQSVDDVLIGDDRKMSFVATVVTQPQFELPNYKGLPITVKSAEVTDDEITASIENLRDQAADFVDVPGRGAAMDDYIVVDYRGTINGQPVHEVFPKAGKPLTANDDFWIRMTDEAFFPGYCAHLVGANVDDVREFDVEVPKDFPVEGMPGAVIHYAVTLKGIKERVLPPLDDAFAESVAKGKTLAELRELAKDELTRQKATTVEAEKRNELMRQLLASVECELPQSMVRNETQRILSDIVRENQERGVADEVLKENQQQLVGAASQNAREKLKGSFILIRIAEKENIKVTREELFGRIATLAQKYEMTFEKMLKELEKRGGIDQISEEILTAKVLDFLVANASVSAAA
jgi:trigger factor